MLLLFLIFFLAKALVNIAVIEKRRKKVDKIHPKHSRNRSIVYFMSENWTFTQTIFTSNFIYKEMESTNKLNAQIWSRNNVILLFKTYSNNIINN